MPQYHYGQTTFEWDYQRDDTLKRHYVTVERGQPVMLRGPLIEASEQEALVRHRARWIREKLALVNQPQAAEAIVTGSRLCYAGRRYFTEVRHVPGLAAPRLSFTHSRFVVENPAGTVLSPEVLSPLLTGFYRERAEERLPVRVRHWERQTRLNCRAVHIRSFQSRWASCDAQNVLGFHPRVMELPAAVQDYVIVHELCHTIEKSHSKAFWHLVAKHYPDWQHCHELLDRAAAGHDV